MKHRELSRQVARAGPRRWKVLRAVLLCVILAAVLAGGATDRGSAVVILSRDFLEFYSGVFALVGLSAVVVAGLAASGRFTPVRLRILAQSGHRALAVMSMSFLVVHVLLKVLEQHATMLDVIVPFMGGQERARWIGLGTIAAEMMVLVHVGGVARSRFIGRGRPWAWRVLHLIAYLCWPVAIVHGLNAGRAPKDWVTLSYVACLALVAVAALIRFVLWLRGRGKVRRQAGRVTARTTRHVSGIGAHGIPDEEFWAELKHEAQLWTGSHR
ncbi:hypothetical protein ABGB18_26175 [Nonomuraea sp. B12E4]|uniref:hypothetical protein n=1 Tax=Nonomuraea sp. B12E4 TaxID=3153564 RepID=UPI00325C5B50